MKPAARRLVEWLAGPALLAIFAGILSATHRAPPPNEFGRRLASLSEAQRRALEAAPMRAIAEVVWAFGNITVLKRNLESELTRTDDSEPQVRARLLLRRGIIEPNPEAQWALFAEACSADSTTCPQIKDLATREAEKRHVSPGSSLPLSLMGSAHPPVP
ncbi:MAG TPA: hypothetical protein VFQ61_12385 [Polyangiaceae bacterium]|nr:hypothetical protein [Polyangiaceae bacterium]